jgi:hydrogenase expression/formation protein HypC
MCLTGPARLLAVDGPTGVVDVDGRRRRASLLFVPEAVPGDWLLVGAGTALRRLEPDEARELGDLIATAVAATATAATATVAAEPPAPTGGQP